MSSPMILIALTLIHAITAATIEVEIHDFEFVPRQVKAFSGDTIHFTNRSSHPHTVTGDPRGLFDPNNVELPEGAEPFDSGSLRPGAEYSLTLTTSGFYRYTCRPHEKLGMQGEIELVPSEL